MISKDWHITPFSGGIILFLLGCASGLVSVVDGFSLPTINKPYSAISPSVHHNSHFRRSFQHDGKHSPCDPRSNIVLYAQKNEASEGWFANTVAAFEECVQKTRRAIRRQVLIFFGLEDLISRAVSDDSWESQIINTSNINRKNITVDSVVTTWKEELNGEGNDDFLDNVWRNVLGDWSKVRKNKILMGGIRAACVAALTWGFLASILVSSSISGIRIWTALRQKTFIMTWSSFLLENPEHRQVILNTYTMLRIRFGPVYFAVNALGTLLLVPYYENAVCTIERLCFTKKYREKYPLVSRLQGLVLSFFVGWAFARLITLTGILVGTSIGLSKRWLMHSVVTIIGLINGFFKRFMLLLPF